MSGHKPRAGDARNGNGVVTVRFLITSRARDERLYLWYALKSLPSPDFLSSLQHTITDKQWSWTNTVAEARQFTSLRELALFKRSCISKRVWSGWDCEAITLDLAIVAEAMEA